MSSAIVFACRNVARIRVQGRPLKAHAATGGGPSGSTLSPRKRRLAEQQRQWQERQDEERAAKARLNKDKLKATELLFHKSSGDRGFCTQAAASSDADVISSASHAAASTSGRGEEDDLPFRLFPGLLSGISLQGFLDEVELKQDTIYMEDNSRAISESRKTGWQSDIGATFKYSGKEMLPAGPCLTPGIAKVRDSLVEATGVHFDSVLINLYGDGRCGMRYHADPLYGCWTPNAAVVSIGQTRKFIFRETEDFSARWEFLVNNGDVLFMFGDCQERMQHCVKVEREDRGAAEMGARMSLVFKQRIRDTATGQYA